MNPLKTREAPQTSSSLDAECKRLNIVVYLDVFGAYRWEFRQADGHYIDSRESYETREECVQAAIEPASRRMRLHRGTAVLQSPPDVMCEPSQSRSLDARERQEKALPERPLLAAKVF
jgi:uncharacterized protein YegP (UPF0339 family)